MPKNALPAKVTEKLKSLPAKPGCYIYKDVAGEVLYVGKALVLKNRVRSYFQASTRHGARIERMVRKVCDLEYIVVDSEVEALVLECTLIKQYRPPFNVRLRDDKSYPYVIITKEKFPRVLFTRKLRKDGGKYFGPFTSAGSVRETLQLLHKIFPLIPCGKSWSGRAEQRPCLYYHLGQCLGPCAGLADHSEYAKVVKRIEQFLDGKTEGVVEGIRAEMKAASDELDFERAVKLRNQLQSIENLLQRQKVLSQDRTDQDVIAVVKDERGSSIQMLYIRNGKLIGQRHFVLDGSSEAAPSEAVGQFVKQYYADSLEVPREILLPVEIEERNIVQQWLRTKKGSAVTVGVPQGGEKLKLVEMAAANAEHAMATFSEEIQQKEANSEKGMAELQDAIGLDMPPLRIEGYDISNIQGTSPVGSMVVVEFGEPAKAEYRRFKIRYHPESPNDFAMMHEVITRRLRAYLDGDEKFQRLPDLIMIDGGKGQLGAALKARDELGMTVPMVGLAKKMEIIFVPFEIPSVNSLSLSTQQGAPPRTESEVLAATDTAEGPYGDRPIGEIQPEPPTGPFGKPKPLPSVGVVGHAGSDSDHLALVRDEDTIDPASFDKSELSDEENELELANREGGGKECHETPLEMQPDSLSAREVGGAPAEPGERDESKAPLEDRPLNGSRMQKEQEEYSFEKPAPREYRYEGIELPLTSCGLMLLRRLRDEAHRFALTYHRKLRDKRFSGSALEEIPGVGPRRKRLLLRTFGSLEGIRRASAEEIASVPTMTKRLAEQVRDYLKEG
jgi:excinuclease ABC subunit C